MTAKTNRARTANDTATREEVTAVSTLTADAVSVFLNRARQRGEGFASEAAAYVAAIDADGKRGATSRVQAAIAAALTGEGFEPYSAARYSYLANAHRAAVALDCDALAGDVFGIFYALFNLPSGKMTGAQRDAVLAGAKRKRSPEARVAFIAAAIATAKGDAKTRAASAAAADTAEENTADDTPATDAPATDAPTDAAAIVEMLASIAAMLPTLTDDARIRIADAAQDLADAAHALTVPAPALTLTDAA